MRTFLSRLDLAVAALAVMTAAAVPRAEAVTFKVASTGGLMQQPTSHYYHAVYGAAVDVARDGQGLIGRVQYVERPEFADSGFNDKDYGAFGMVGTTLLKTAKTGGNLLAFFGAGRMAGYVRAEAETRSEVPVAERRYTIPGPTAAVEYSYRWQHFDVAINHQTFIGYADRVQTDAYVAWPFNFFQVTMGVLW